MLFNIDEVKTQLSKLVDRVLKGKRVVITRAGKPCIALTSHQERSEPRKPCRLRGQICMHDGFDDADEQIQALFEGES